MNKLKFVSVLIACLLGLTILMQSHQETAIAQDSAKKPAATKKASSRKKARGRLPMYYGQIGLSNAQREKIYAVQAKYRPQIAELLKQVAALREKQKEEIDAVLTSEQKEELAKLLEKRARKGKNRLTKKE